MSGRWALSVTCSPKNNLSLGFAPRVFQRGIIFLGGPWFPAQQFSEGSSESRPCQREAVEKKASRGKSKQKTVCSRADTGSVAIGLVQHG